ncbi:MAG: CRISPR system precrRNA processing endoribonuclease RAMP protein Cas6 [Desulfobacteraceae bacterium]|nr:CRISPR system precrRNA processing endoribonuclease RAMP protein Cas6 [Desulfobacteraceae bacterium]
MKNVSESPLIAPLLPLFSLRVARFRIEIASAGPVHLFGAEPKFRGSLGYHLRRLCCPAPDFRKAECSVCTLYDNCLYVSLFTPETDFPVTGTCKKGIKQAVRPFVISLCPGQGRHLGILDITLFGNAIPHAGIFAEAVIAAASSLSFRVRLISRMLPDGTSVKPGDESLQDWVEAGLESGMKNPGKGTMRLCFATPVNIVEKGKPIVMSSICFTVIIKALVRRMRDLKRVYGSDPDMGKTVPELFSCAGAVEIMENRLEWSRRQRYSYQQKQGVSLSGLFGNICFENVMPDFWIMLKAGEIVHLGKGITNGNGKILLE